ncbi:cytochrome c oxidase subunit 3 family protein [Novispirillum itersonii]|uniref:cytochrome c oxidase subunit 3 family protein n=1 Tax=Novispirillum itersonii TaxID=189 RepID=UPI000375805A|nr:cytochrome c oxidase subunit 3 family protein [Novispirillum itersonii]
MTAPDRDSPPEETGGEAADWGALSALPGNPLMWILILSELAVFGAFLIGFTGARIADPGGFADSQALLSRVDGGLNTLVLITSGWMAALAGRASHDGRQRACRGWLLAALALGAVFLAVKAVEYSGKAALGIGLETNTFFTLYYLITGFHALHVVLGMVILGIGIWRPARDTVETGTAFWHMVDLIWVLVYPVIYLVR